jgi:hypothetical protein
MAGQFRQVAAADAAHFALYDPVKNVMSRLGLGEERAFRDAERLMEDSSGSAWQNRQSQVIPDLVADTRFLSGLKC